MKKTLAIVLCIAALTLLLCACGGTGNDARDGGQQTGAAEPATVATPPSAASTASTPGAEGDDVDALLKDLDGLTAGDDYEDITIDEPGAGAIEDATQDIVTDLGKNFDMPVD